ncbi:MAG: ATP-dependent DNA helicase RecG [Bariatricus sp.]|nr:ATP-dependent DNA helicase RecG [Bariatricus sp.]
MNEQSRINELKGIGEKTEKLFQKMGIYTVGDLLRYYPRGYDVYEEPVSVGELEEGKTQAVSGVIYGRVQVGGGRNMQVTTAYVKDITGTLKVVWFRMPFLRNTLKSGMPIIVRGQVINKKGQLVMEHPEIFDPPGSYDAKKNSLQPIYPLTSGITNNAVAKAVRQAFDYLDLSRDFIPKDVRRNYHLAEYNYALQGIHFPLDKQEFFHARQRLVFEEFLTFILALRQTKEKNERAENGFSIEKRDKIEEFLASLPYELTGAQKKVWREIVKEMTGPYVMSRLIQGDVGSGKTIIAVLALMLAGLNGLQGAMMAPTEVLAKQHFESVTQLFETYHIPLKAELLTGSMTAKEKRLAYERIASGEVQIILGTHALIQEKVVYQNLALVITDEQHRFGVRQRETLAGKGKVPHILVMSATPIPRTLAIILYGDLDISVIDELPANRLPIKNCVVDTSYRPTAYNFMKKQVSAGRQCYVICPMVEESEAMEAENVMDYAAMLQEEMGDEIHVEALHGKMKQAIKDEIMERFGKNEIQILVSTTVIEVGINVPNATVMMVENAERFGLAQLHQLRGRVGRGEHQSYCIFMSGSKTKETKKRLEILNKSNDGFYIANEDLKLRGPGDLFGIRQSGLMDFRIGDVFQDADVLQMANRAAGDILQEDPYLELEKNRKLKEHLGEYCARANLESTL